MTEPLAGNLIFDSETVAIRSIAVSEMENNVYLLTSKATGAQILIDAADDFDRIHEFVTAAAGEDCHGALQDVGPENVRAIITTHSHWDHIRALPAALEAYAPVASYCGAPDADAIEEQEGIRPETLLADGESVTVEDISLDVIALRGHTPGSVALVYKEPTDPAAPVLLFTGDSLFPGGVGKTNSPQDFAQLLGDVRTRIFDVFDDNTVVFPGHGNSTTLGADRGNLDAWEARGW